MKLSDNIKAMKGKKSYPMYPMDMKGFDSEGEPVQALNPKPKKKEKAKRRYPKQMVKIEKKIGYLK